ncbi:MAG: hypothetical protein H0U76_24705 [Ktedonobacteraceae bacterium]|nr:hypothetical protein [Ktedonobacteraceae bacterium]
MVDTTVILVVATTALSGVGAGASLDVSIKQLPARHRIGVIAYSVYSQATDLGTARVWYPPLGIGTLLLALATAMVAFFQHVTFAHALPIFLVAALWVVHVLITLIWALPTLPRQRQVAHDAPQLAALFNQFERLQTVRAALDVLIFGTTLWALVSYVS